MRASQATGGAAARRKGRILFFVLVALALQTLVILAAIFLGPTSTPATTRQPAAPPQAAQPDTGPDSAHTPHEPVPDEMLYTYDIEDERIVVALSENVFAGRVTRLVGREPATSTIPDDPGRPQLQFAVDILASAKAAGPAPVKRGGEIVVNQEVGLDRKTGATLPIDAAFCGKHLPDELLSAGKVYLFATYYEPDRGLHTLTAQPTGNIPVSTTAEAETLVAAYATYKDAAVDETGRIEGGKPCE